jgi:translation elongation factor EF-Ts
MQRRDGIDFLRRSLSPSTFNDVWTVFRSYDFDFSVWETWLRKKVLAAAAQKSGVVTAEGLIGNSKSRNRSSFNANQDT